VTALAVALLVPAALMSVPSAAGAAPPDHTVVLTTTSGSLTTWPDYDASVSRFAVEPSPDNDTTATVVATTSDPAGRVRVNGQVVASGTAVPVQLHPGEELSVIIDDAGGHSAQSWIELPSTFPHLSTAGTLQQDPAAPEAHVFLTLGNFLTTTPYETIVDGHAVPSWFEQGSGSDLKPVDLGATRYAIARPVTGGGYQIDELDSSFHTLRSHRLANVPASTDFHDSQLLPGGRTLMLGYDGNAGFFDAVIQIVDADGHPEFSWNSRVDGHVDPSETYVTRSAADYAHINSLQYLPNGDILASFRNLSQVMRIATTDHDGFTSGEVIWRLGGKRNQFAFDDPGFGGNCAQHMARMLPNGHLMIFDNGSREDPLTSPIGGQSADMCPDPAAAPSDPPAPSIARPQTRVVEYALDEQTHTAARVWQFVPNGRYAAFAGSQQRLADGTTFIGWSQSNDATGLPVTEPVASQVNASGDQEIWSLFGSNWFTYRAAIGPAPDAISPQATITSPADGASYVEGQQVVADFGCTDTGGSNLDRCQGTAADTAFVNTTPGSHVFAVTAVDGAGNQSVRTVHYHVGARSRPDARVRSASGRLVGDNRYGGTTDQRVTARLSAHRAIRSQVSVQNDGAKPDRITLRGTAASARFAVSYRHDGVDVTRRVLRGTLHTPTLAPGATYALTMVTHRLHPAARGDQRTFTVVATSLLGAGRHDAVAVVARATR
jgi:hypothetical protein